MKPAAQTGKVSLAFQEPVYIQSAASIVGKKEGEGPLRDCFDMVSEDPRFGTDTWENAESTLQKETAVLAIGKAGLKPSDIRMAFAGDLLAQTIASSFGIADMGCMVPAPRSVSPFLSEPCPSQPVTVHISSAPHPVILLLPKRNFVFRSAMEASARSLQPGQ